MVGEERGRVQEVGSGGLGSHRLERGREIGTTKDRISPREYFLA